VPSSHLQESLLRQQAYNNILANLKATHKKENETENRRMSDCKAKLWCQPVEKKNVLSMIPEF
jgi:hypothetical protein